MASITLCHVPIRPGTARVAQGLQGLSVRAVNCLSRMGLSSREDIRTAVRRRVLHPANVQAQNFGWKTYQEVCRWLGLRLPITNRRVHEVRCSLAYQLRTDGHSMEEIATILRLGSKNKARDLVAHAGWINRCQRER
jgi:hypothetical protein